jgi:hypothetical protein
MTRQEQLEIINRMLEKDPSLPMERDEIRVALSIAKAQKKLIEIMREKQRHQKNLQAQSDMGKMIREEEAKTLRELLESCKRVLQNLLSNE